jgi:hypothetical protein
VPLGDGARELVDYLLFIDEAPLTAIIQGSTSFADTFAGQGPQDHLGRSLRQRDLNRRLMRYPCGYMIYSAQFDRLPLEAKNAIYSRIWQVLSGAETDTAAFPSTIGGRSSRFCGRRRKTCRGISNRSFIDGEKSARPPSV